MPKDESIPTNVLLHLDPETYESLEQFGKEEHVSVHHSTLSLFNQAFELWRKGKLDIEITDKARSNYSRGRGARGPRPHFSHKKKEGQL
jgi:hypothetical protein